MPIPTYHLESQSVLGRGAYGAVYKAIDTTSEHHVALKKTRVSQKVKRTILQYESWVIQLLQGHPAIPILFGYGRLPHFEYLAMELLGPSVNECTSGGPIAVKTVTQVVLKMLSALEHIHKCGFVHGDIKPENILCCPADPSRIVLIDYGVSRPIKRGPVNSNKLKLLVGTADWASLNAHDNIDLSPRDDLESLAYVALFLLRGNLPWISLAFHSWKKTRAIKAAESGAKLGANFPVEFGRLLDYARRLEYDQPPDYEELQRQFAEIGIQIGNKDAKSPLDWSPVSAVIISNGEGNKKSDSTPEDIDEDDDDEDDDEDEDDEVYPNSYRNWDISEWDMRSGRHRNLTLPPEQVELVKSKIPQVLIEDVVSW
ncbi:kinase-like protein [Pholiota conissans]|uniref:non-specific serine/threonine protein kinase n=1 Tax=Pholiota conissans TaxID=109636 RepID=A0A9P5ZDE3_9AGAR|nr:kinase-like protein [Pholiota conissans]